MELIFASRNIHKAREINKMLGDGFQVKTMVESGIDEDIPETGSTLQENALLKARYIYERTGKPCFADDTGLEVEALSGEPGVYSARFAGMPPNDERNMQLLLEKMKGQEKRSAQFRTVIALMLHEKDIHFFEGIAKGEIITMKRGEQGFGYDPLFVPEGHTITFAEMSTEEKNKISHRGKALDLLKEFLLKR